MFPQFQEIKETSVDFTVNKMIQGCVGKVGIFKRSDAVGTSIFFGSSEDMSLNPTLDFLSDIPRGGWNFSEENLILLYLNVFKAFFYAGRAF